MAMVKKHELRQAAYMRGWITAVRGMIADGSTMAEVRPYYDAGWNNGYTRLEQAKRDAITKSRTKRAERCPGCSRGPIDVNDETGYCGGCSEMVL
jgi:hypothetical protein